LPPLVTLDAEYRGLTKSGYSGNVLYLSTLSKTLAPGLRLGWIIGPADVVQRLGQAKQGTDLHTSTFTQLVAYEVARGGFLGRHRRSRRHQCGARHPTQDRFEHLAIYHGILVTATTSSKLIASRKMRPTSGVLARLRAS